MKFLITAVLLMASLTSCLSEQVRDEALVPAASLAWVGVRADLERGIDDAVEDGDLVDREGLDASVEALDAALENGALRSELNLIAWEVLLPYAERGIQDRIDDGEMHELVAESLRERLRNFTYAFDRLRMAHAPLGTSSTKEFWLAGGTRVTDEAAIATATSN